jgi:hypothetical protein
MKTYKSQYTGSAIDEAVKKIQACSGELLYVENFSDADGVLVIASAPAPEATETSEQAGE